MRQKHLAAILLLIGFNFPLGAKADVPILGDVTGPAGPDGKVDVTDAVRLLKTVLGQHDIFQDEFVRSDVAPLNSDGTRGDGVLDIRDVVTLLRWSAGIGGTPPEPSSLFYEGYTSLDFPNVKSHLVRRLAFSLRWVEKPGQPIEARAILYPGRCIGYSLPDHEVQLRGVEDNQHNLVLQGGYVPVHPQIRFGEWIEMRLKINLLTDVGGEVGRRTLNSCAYEEELRGFAPEPIVNDGLFLKSHIFIDPAPLNRLRDPIFPIASTRFLGPSSDSYRQGTTGATDAQKTSAVAQRAAANAVSAGFVQFAEKAAADPVLSPFLNASPVGLYDAIDALPVATYSITQERQSAYASIPSATSVGGYPAFEGAAAHAVVTTLPVLRSTDASTAADSDLLNALRLGFLYSSDKVLAAERDIRGAEDDALFDAPLTISQEDTVMGRGLVEYGDALYGTIGALAVGPVASMGRLEDGLLNSEVGTLPILQVKNRDYRLVARILSGLSEARVEHARRSLAVQDWTRAELQCEQMTMEIRLAVSLMDAQSASLSTVTADNSQELVQAFDNLTTLGDLYTSAELQLTPVGTLLNRPQDPNLGVTTVGQYDYPQVTEAGDYAVNSDVKTTLGFLVQQRIQDITGNSGTPNTIANLQTAEEALRTKIGTQDSMTRSVLQRRNDAAFDLTRQLTAIVDFRQDGTTPAIAFHGETASPQIDATVAALLNWEGTAADTTWVASWRNGQGSLQHTYHDAFGFRQDVDAAEQQLDLARQKLSTLETTANAEGPIFQALLKAQESGAEEITANAAEIQQSVDSILQSSPMINQRMAFSASDNAKQSVDCLIGNCDAPISEAVGSAGGKIGLNAPQGKGCWVRHVAANGASGAIGGLTLTAVAIGVGILCPPCGAVEAVGAALGVGTGIGLVAGGIHGAISASDDCGKSEGTKPPAVVAVAPMSNRVAIGSAVPMTQKPTSTGMSVGQTISNAQTGKLDAAVVSAIKWNADNTFQIGQNTYQMNQKLDNLVNLTNGAKVTLDRIDNKLVKIDDQLVDISTGIQQIGGTLGNIDMRLGMLQQVVTNSYNLQIQQFNLQADQYQEQLRQGQALSTIIGIETTQTQILGHSLGELDQIKSIGAISAVANARLAADGQRIQAEIGAITTNLQMTQRQSDLRLQMLSIQGEIVAAANEIDQKQAALQDKVANLMELIRQARILVVRLKSEQTTPLPTLMDLQNKYALAASYKAYRDQLDGVRYRIWQLARLVEYYRNDDFPAFNETSADLFSGGFNYAMVFRARNAGELAKALTVLQSATLDVPSLQAASDVMISLKRQVMPAQTGFSADSDFHEFLRQMHGKTIEFSTGVSGFIQVLSDGTPGTNPSVDLQPQLYNHLIWAAHLVYQGTARVGGNATLEQEGTTMLRTADAQPGLFDAEGFTEDHYRSVHLAVLNSVVPLVNVTDYLTSRDPARDPNRLSTFAFKNRPLVSTWKLVLPPLSDIDINGIDDIDVAFEVNVRTKVLH